MNYPKIIIIILNWNGKEDTIECLESLKKITYPNYEILLVDNGSTDGSLECFRERYPGMEIIENGENLGFAEGNNVGIRKAIEIGADYVLLLNNDTVVDKEFLGELIKVAESDRNIGIVGPIIYYYISQNRIQSAGAKVYWNTGNQNILRANELDVGQHKIEEVDYVSGCALLAKSELFEKIGYLNKEYFAYWEETDWCISVKKSGYKVLCIPKAKVWHKGQSSSNKISGLHTYYMTRNMFWFMKKHACRIDFFVFLVYFFGFKFWFKNSIFLIYHKDLKLSISFCKGVIDGIRDIH